MKKNLGSIDRTVRLLGAVVIAVLYFTGLITGTTAIVSGILAIILVGTSLLSFCPLYTLLHLSSRKEGQKAMSSPAGL